MPMMPVTDSMFLLVETREHPMHVGGLQLFKKPEGAGPDYLSASGGTCSTRTTCGRSSAAAPPAR